MCSSNDHNWKHTLAAISAAFTKFTNVNRPFIESEKTDSNYSESSRFPELLLCILVVVTTVALHLDHGLFPLKTTFKYQGALQHRTVLSFITLQTRTGAWSCLYFSLCDTSSLSRMPPPNPQLSRIYPPYPSTHPPPPPPHLYPCSTAHKHSRMPVVITVGHNFRDNLKTIYYPWSIKKKGHKHFVDVHLQPIDRFINGSLIVITVQSLQSLCFSILINFTHFEQTHLKSLTFF